MNNKIALVTGGSRGLGKNMALRIADKGSDVILTYNSKEDEATAVVKEIEAKERRAATLQLNVGETKSFDNFIASLSRHKCLGLKRCQSHEQRQGCCWPAM
jgi:NAD(P)-dependent dehydrogenase (short-subunit alcohol dehydrogenase family)